MKAFKSERGDAPLLLALGFAAVGGLMMFAQSKMANENIRQSKRLVDSQARFYEVQKLAVRDAHLGQPGVSFACIRDKKKKKKEGETPEDCFEKVDETKLQSE